MLTYDRKLQFHPSKPFKILQLTDLLYGESPDLDSQTTNLQTTLLQTEKPDLVIITGPTVFTPLSIPRSPTWFTNMHKTAIRTVQQLNYTWALVSGTDSSTHLLEFDSNQPGSSTLCGWNNGLDYILPIYETDQEQPSALLMILNSAKCRTDCEQEQMQWLSSVFGKWPALRELPAHVFIQNPLPDQVHLSLSSHSSFSRLDDISLTDANTELLDTLVELGNVVSIQCGHDHSAEFYGTFKGLNLVYGKKSGYTGQIQRSCKK